MSCKGGYKTIYTADEVKIAESRAMGYTYRQIAMNKRLTMRQVKNSLNNSKVKRLVASLKNQLMERVLPVSVGNIKKVIDDYQIEPVIERTKKELVDGKVIEVPCEMSKVEGILVQQRKEHGFKASIEVMKSAGLLANPATPTLIIQNNDNRSIVNNAMGRFMENEIMGQITPGGDEIDVEPETQTQ